MVDVRPCPSPHDALVSTHANSSLLQTPLPSVPAFSLAAGEAGDSGRGQTRSVGKLKSMGRALNQYQGRARGLPCDRLCVVSWKVPVRSEFTDTLIYFPAFCSCFPNKLLPTKSSTQSLLLGNPTKISCQYPAQSARCGSAVKNLTRIHEDSGLIPGLIQWVGIWCCHELWYRSETWLGSGVAVAVVQAGTCSSDLTPSLGTSICHRWP